MATSIVDQVGIIAKGLKRLEEEKHRRIAGTPECVCAPNTAPSFSSIWGTPLAVDYDSLADYYGNIITGKP